MGGDSRRKERCYVGIKAEISDIWKGEKETERGNMREESSAGKEIMEKIFH